jgi:hypothetical protein
MINPTMLLVAEESALPGPSIVEVTTQTRQPNFSAESSPIRVYRERAADVAAIVRSEGGTAAACDAIESVLS